MAQPLTISRLRGEIGSSRICSRNWEIKPLETMFELVSPYQPAGDQPQAIAKLTEGLVSGAKHQTLLGVTGSGKTFTVANAIRNVNKPTLVISHNKTLAAH